LIEADNSANTGLGDSLAGQTFRPENQKEMPSINGISGSGSSASATAYQEYLARLQAQKEAARASETGESTQEGSGKAGDVDQDGDKH